MRFQMTRSIFYLISIACTILLISHWDYRKYARPTTSPDVQPWKKRSSYPPRKDMEECPKAFGKVSIFVAYSNGSADSIYKVAQASLNCYLKSTNYNLIAIDLDEDERVKTACGHHSLLFFRKHCAVAEYLRDTDWMLVLDADTGVVNPNHCIEEWIDDRVNILFYERFFNFEIASGNYIVRNSKFSYEFLMKWADWEFSLPTIWNGYDNGALHIHVLEVVLPDAKQEHANCKALWNRATDYQTYLAYVTCVKLVLGATKMWPGKLRIFRKAHGWVRDGHFTSDRWCDRDFMLHGWKHNNITEKWESPFEVVPDPALCGRGKSGWKWRSKNQLNVDSLRLELEAYEKSIGLGFPQQAQVIPHLELPEVGLCYPKCDADL